MYNIDKRVLQKILKRRFDSLVGISCERFENFIKNYAETVDKKAIDTFLFSLKKDSYNAMRNIDEQVSSFSQGTKINVKLERPISE